MILESIREKFPDIEGENMIVTPNDVRETLKTPDKTWYCGGCKTQVYIKNFKDKGELFVQGTVTIENTVEIKCFGWLQNMLYPSESN